MHFHRACVVVTLISLAAARPETPKLSLGLGAESYVVGGAEAVDGEWPSALSLEFLGTSGWGHICGAVLYKDRYALTAAHCVYGNAVSNLRLWAGTLDRSNPAATDGEVLPVASYLIHPEFSALQAGAPNNIAIITLTIPPDTTHPNIASAVLPPFDSDFNHGGCFTVGYGRTSTSGSMSNTLQWLQIPVITNSDCADRVQLVEHTAIYPSHICVLSDPPGFGPCNGDAGGPLYCHPSEQDTSVTYLAGLISWNVAVNGNCNLQYPSVSSRVTFYRDWIEASTP